MELPKKRPKSGRDAQVERSLLLEQERNVLLKEHLMTRKSKTTSHLTPQAQFLLGYEQSLIDEATANRIAD